MLGIIFGAISAIGAVLKTIGSIGIAIQGLKATPHNAAKNCSII